MSCGLSSDELFILHTLYTGRCVRKDKGFHSKLLEKKCRYKFGKNGKKEVKNLKNKGYIAPVGKSPEKYYICDIKGAIFALDSHGYNVTKGRERKL